MLHVESVEHILLFFLWFYENIHGVGDHSVCRQIGIFNGGLRII